MGAWGSILSLMKCCERGDFLMKGGRRLCVNDERWMVGSGTYLEKTSPRKALPLAISGGLKFVWAFA